MKEVLQTWQWSEPEKVKQNTPLDAGRNAGPLPDSSLAGETIPGADKVKRLAWSRLRENCREFK